MKTKILLPGDDVTPPSGRRFTEVQASMVEIAWLEAKGVSVTRAGSFTETYETDEEVGK